MIDRAVRAAKPAPLATPEARAAEPAAEGKTVQRALRVDQSKIDAIMNLVAELIVAKMGCPTSPTAPKSSRRAAYPGNQGAVRGH